MIVTTSLWALPLLIAASTIEAFLVLLFARAICERIRQPWASRTSFALKELTEPILTKSRNEISRWSRHSVPAWVAWLLVVFVALLARHAIIILMLRMSP